MRPFVCSFLLIIGLTLLSADAIGQHAVPIHSLPPNAPEGGVARGSGPPNDECSGAMPHTLVPGSTVTFSGDNTGATMSGEPLMGEVFEAFTLTSCSMVTIDYCAAGSIFQSFYYVIGADCATVHDNSQNIAGGADDCSVTFLDLEPGTYYIPVLVWEGHTPIGPYSFTASASSCESYCAASALDASQEIISDVTFGGTISLAGYQVGYDDETMTVMEAVAGTTSPIDIDLFDGNADDVSMVWIDLDRNGELADEERVFTSAVGSGPHQGNITIPANATTGLTRMRIRMQRTTDWTNTEACGDHEIGQVKDYTVRILPSGTGIEDVIQPDIGVSPNPSAGEFTVRGFKGRASIDVLDMAGRLLYSTMATGDADVRLNLRGRVGPGTYVLRCTIGVSRSERRIMVY